MIKRGILLSAIVILFCAPGMAQNLDSVTVSDQFTSGTRGNEASACYGPEAPYYGATCEDGSDAVNITNANGATGTIGFINTWAGASTGDAANGETPVVNITNDYKQPDRALAIAESIPQNTRPGATSPTMAVIISDDGGHNGLYWGEADNSSYYVQADVYCEDRTGDGISTGYEVAAVAIRCASRNGGWTDYTFNVDRSGSYAIVHDRILNTIEALKYTDGNSVTEVTSRAASSKTVFATQSNVTEGWHTFKIAADGDQVKFYVNEVAIAEVRDASYESGYPGLFYRENSVASEQEHPAIFDNMISGPYTVPVPDTPTASSSVERWELFE